MAWNVIDALNKNTQAAAVDNTPKARFRVKDISINKIYSNAKNFYSMPDIEQLAQDIYAVGLLENLTVVYAPSESGDYRLIAGERRWRALKLLTEQGHKEFEFVSCQVKTPAEENEEIVQLIIANTYRNKTAKDILEEEQRLKETLQKMKKDGLTLQGYKLDSGRLRDIIADMLKMPTTKIAQIESINKRLIPQFTEELKEGRLTFSAAYELSGMTEEEQNDLLEKYEESGLTFKEIKEAKENNRQQTDGEQIPGQIEMQEENPNETEKAQNETENDQNETEKTQNETEEVPDEPEEDPDEYEDAHPESITSLCYSCARYESCNVKTGTCRSCDRYLNRAEAQKTAEQRYNEEQEKIDRETARKLKEQEEAERIKTLPSEKEKKVHSVKIGKEFFEDVKNNIKTFELRKNDRNYKVGETLELHEYEAGEETGRTCRKLITYMLKEFTGLQDGYCILGLKDE
nr:MAG TPA: chromosome partitioning protein [Bacteriophage sp.]